MQLLEKGKEFMRNAPREARRGLLLAAGSAAIIAPLALVDFNSVQYFAAEQSARFIPLPELDREDYDARMRLLAHLPAEAATMTATSTTPLWPVAAPYPNARAILPFKRVVAYYGNFYSDRMGILGELPDEELIAKLKGEQAAWEAADPSTPVVPAVHYIAVVAQAGPGKDGKYRLRMPDDQIEHALSLAAKMQGIVFLDIQVGLSDLQTELPALEKYLSLPQVHLGIDPEFSMKGGEKPGTVIGTFDAADINYAAEYLAALVEKYDLPPKILVVHRFTRPMMTNYRAIRPLPEVQMVVNMDGWGEQAKKKGTYNLVVYPEPVQFAGLKIFYKADMKPPSTGLLTIEEVLALKPKPIYIQYQ